jgi:Retrotransposon gag protein
MSLPTGSGLNDPPKEGARTRSRGPVLVNPSIYPTFKPRNQSPEQGQPTNFVLRKAEFSRGILERGLEFIQTAEETLQVLPSKPDLPEVSEEIEPIATTIFYENERHLVIREEALNDFSQFQPVSMANPVVVNIDADLLADAFLRATEVTAAALPAVLPKSFSQAPGEDVGIFLRNFNTVANAQRWTDAVKLARIPMCLSGSALDWWNRQSAIPATWVLLHNELITQFRAPGYLELKQEELKGRRMEKNESLHEYYSSVLLLFDILTDLGKTYTATERTKRLINGLCANFPVLFNDLSNKNITTELEFFQQASERVQTYKKLERRNEALPRHTLELATDMKKGLQFDIDTLRTLEQMQNNRNYAIVDSPDSQYREFNRQSNNNQRGFNHFGKIANQMPNQSRSPCKVCGHTNHTTQNCYHSNQQGYSQGNYGSSGQRGRNFGTTVEMPV